MSRVLRDLQDGRMRLAMSPMLTARESQQTQGVRLFLTAHLLAFFSPAMTAAIPSSARP